MFSISPSSMESRSTGRFALGKQYSFASNGNRDEIDGYDVPEEINSQLRLMYLASEGDLEGMKELLDSGADANFIDIDGRTALHVAACQERPEVVELLLKRGAKVDPQDRWGSTPLEDAMHYNNHNVIKLLEKYGAKVKIAPMHVKTKTEVPEYEIDPSELDFSESFQITKGTFRVAMWRGSQVAVKTLSEDVLTDENKVSAFRDELALLQQIRHPNVVQFLGAVTQSSPMMIVTEYLPKGDVCAFLKRKGAIKPATAVLLALDIARGMNYLHEHKPPIVHRDLEPSNILRDDSGHLKVADFGVSKLMKVTRADREDRLRISQDTACRYLAPEVFRNEEYDTKADIFSFALILQEMIEGLPPFHNKPDTDIPKAYASKERPRFRAAGKCYEHGLKKLIKDCWNENPTKRPTFRDIIDRLTYIQRCLAAKRSRKMTFACLPNLEIVWSKDRNCESISSARSTITDA